MATLYSFFVRSLYRYALIKPGERVLLAVSGGVDSMVMAHLFARLRDSSSDNFYLEAVHVVIPEVKLSEENMSKMCRYLEEWKVPLTVIEGKIRRGYKFGCYVCSKERRKKMLLHYYEKRFSALAIGHNEEDYIETGLLNLIFHGNLLSLDIQEYMFDKSVRIIRPMIIVKK
ncbi:MAG: hypothetical protein J7K33_03560, partial [Candidatus Marinimicrobia bacterium]|nr:hypothetical protein [Candidatus Neomarinimicrobiota bacterium]